MKWAVLREAAAAALPVATAPVWGPPVVEIFGQPIPVAATILSVLGLIMARLVASAREGKTPGNLALTILLIVLLIGLVIERQPGPGMAVAWGVGIGAGGILIVDVLRKAVLRLVGQSAKGEGS